MERKVGFRFADMAKRVAAETAKEGKVNNVFEDSFVASSKESPSFQGFRRMDSYAKFRRPSEPCETEVADDMNEKRKSSFAKLRRGTIRASLKDRLRKIIDERLTIRQIFQRYVEHSTLHGFRYTCSDTYFIRRLIWSVLMILGAAYFIWKLKEGIIEYFDYPFSTLFMVSYTTKLNYPAISICPLNSYKLHELENTPLRRLKDRLPLDKSWKDPGFDISGDEYAKYLYNISYKIEELMKDCDWIKRDTNHPDKQPNPCGTSNFTMFFNKRGQLCYTLNSGKDGHPLLSVQHAGLNYGYELLFDLNNSEALKSFLYTGMRIIIHDQDEPPVMEEGFSISPGFKTFVKLSRVETENLPPPYATQCGEKELKYFPTYNQKACLLELLTDYTGEKCGCRELFMPDNGRPLCSLRQSIMCMLPAKESFDEFSMRQKCPVDCEVVSYTVRLSDSRYLHNPPKGTDEIILTREAAQKKVNETHLLKLLRQMTSKELDQYVEQNIIQVIFFYGELKKDILQQEASFDFYQFLGDMGGEIGLMLGASLLTFVEFVDLIIFLIYHQLLRFQKKTKAKDAQRRSVYEAIEEEEDEDEEMKENDINAL